jgi:hypothetical protein
MSLPCYPGVPCFNNQKDAASYEMENTPMTQICHHIFFETHYGKAHFIFLILFLVAMSGLIASYSIEDGFLYNSPNVLCVGSRLLKAFVGFGCMGCILFILIGFGAALLSVGKKKSGFMLCICLTFCVSIVLLFIALMLILMVGINEDTYVLIQGSNSTIYECLIAAHRNEVFVVRFLTNMDEATQSNQTCTFQPKSLICDPVFILFRDSLSWIDVNGTEGALACESSDPEGHDSCSFYFTVLQVLFGAEVFCFFFVPFSCFVFAWISLDGNPKTYFDKCCCSECCQRCFGFQVSEERQPLSPGKKGE